MSASAQEVALLAATVPSGRCALVVGGTAELVDLLTERGVLVEQAQVAGVRAASDGPTDAVLAPVALDELDDPEAFVADLASAAGSAGRVVLVVDDLDAACLRHDLSSPEERREGAARLATLRRVGWPGVAELLASAGLVLWWRLGVAPAELADLEAGDSSDELVAAVLGPPSRQAGRHIVVAGVGPAPIGEVPLVTDLAGRLAAAERDRDAALERIAGLERRADLAESAAERAAQLEGEIAKLRREHRAEDAMAQIRADYLAELEQIVANPPPPPECDFRVHARQVASNRVRRYAGAALRALGLRDRGGRTGG
jgi:hypothetical protein